MSQKEQTVSVEADAVALTPVHVHNQLMRKIGKRIETQPALIPSGEALRLAEIHQRTGQALAALASTGVVKGVYRFATHAEMNRHSDEALARAIAANVRLRSGQDKQR